MTTATSAPIEELSRLVAGGRAFRDGWVPIAGAVDSGFRLDTPPVHDPAFVSGGDPSAEANSLRRVLADPQNQAVITDTDPYPATIGDLDGRPAVLFVRGKLPNPNSPTVAIVGSRRASKVGSEAAHRIACELARQGWIVVSGLAAGIDTAAHQGALDCGGRTVAVMGTGLGTVYPSENRELAERIADSGALITQFPPGWEATKTTFPARNALIAGLSAVSVLIEMQERSGTMIEARCALTQGKPVGLWGPLLRRTELAEQLVATTRACFVDDVEDVVALAES